MLGQYTSYCYVMCLLFAQISKDDGIRRGTTMQALAKLKPSFQQGGSTTAGEMRSLPTERGQLNEIRKPPEFLFSVIRPPE